MFLIDRTRKDQLNDIIDKASQDPAFNEASAIDRPDIICRLARIGLGLDPEADIFDITKSPDGQRKSHELIVVMSGIRNARVAMSGLIEQVNT